MRELPHTHSCFVCGESNPIGLKLRFETDGQIVQARFSPATEHAGFKGVAHGGLIATVLDEIMVWACAVRTRRFAFCAELNVRFLKSISPGDQVQLTGELVANRRNKIFETRATARNAAGKIFAAATGKYVAIKSGALADMASELVGGDLTEWNAAHLNG